MPGEWRNDPEIRALMARREREIRTVQAAIGALGGGFTGLASGMHSEVTGWLVAVLAVTGAIAGGVGAYHVPFWKTALPDTPGNDG
jgi:hypothetical protein